MTVASTMNIVVPSTVATIVMTSTNTTTSLLD